ncbi:MAG: hypothetical protein ACD_75C01812G0003 [uncultured bacterium]|nr:MAG: hypothetical protein ACD_75C01812G0003 [uncultured bacterium]
MLTDDVFIDLIEDTAGHRVDGIDYSGGIDRDNPFTHPVEQGPKPFLPFFLGEALQFALTLQSRQGRKQRKQGMLVKTVILFLYLDRDLGQVVLLFDLHGDDIEALVGHQPGNIKDNSYSIFKEQLKFQISGHVFHPRSKLPIIRSLAGCALPCFTASPVNLLLSVRKNEANLGSWGLPHRPGDR